MIVTIDARAGQGDLAPFRLHLDFLLCRWACSAGSARGWAGRRGLCLSWALRWVYAQVQVLGRLARRVLTPG